MCTNIKINKKSHIYKVINYIEENLSDSIDTKALEEHAYVSHMQLYRDFYSITGHSVKEYIRKRRLSNALAFLKHSDFKLADIAYECGYSSQQNLCKAVKAAVHKTPLEYRNSKEYYYFPPFKTMREKQIQVSTEIIPLTLCIRYYQSKKMGIENAAVNHLLSFVPGYSGRIFGRDGKQVGSRFCYELYITEGEQCESLLKTSSFILGDIKQAQENTYAILSVVNKEAEISEAWDYLYGDWLGTSMFEYTKEEYFEEYLIKNSKPAKLKLYLPIIRSSEYTKITFERLDTMKFLLSRDNGPYAEQKASEKVIEYLISFHPEILKSSKEFYVQENADTYICGIRIEAELGLCKYVLIYNFSISGGLFIVLHGTSNSDYGANKDILQNWAANIGVIIDSDEIFAVYDTGHGYENADFKLICPVKNGING